MCEEQHLVRSDLNGCKAPVNLLAVPLNVSLRSITAYPTIIILM